MAGLMVLLMAGCFSIGLYIVGPRIKGGFEQPQNTPNSSAAQAPQEPGLETSAGAGSVDVVELPPLPRPRTRKPQPSQETPPAKASEDARRTKPIVVEPPEEESAWKTPEEEPANEATKGVQPPAPADRIYRVQAGVFEDPDNAQALADRLVEQGFSAAIATERSGDTVRYRVQVGAFKDRERAERLAEELQSKGFDSHISEE